MVCRMYTNFKSDDYWVPDAIGLKICGARFRLKSFFKMVERTTVTSMPKAVKYFERIVFCF